MLSQLTELISPECVYTYDSFLHRCCRSSRHRRRTSRWSECTFCCCTETVHPHTHPLLEEEKERKNMRGEQNPDGSATNGYGGV